MKNVAIDPNGWNFITDAMSRVLLPEGTAPSAHVPGIDIAGKLRVSLLRVGILAFTQESQEIFPHEHLAAFEEVDELLHRLTKSLPLLLHQKVAQHQRQDQHRHDTDSRKHQQLRSQWARRAVFSPERRDG